jgi:hypothetical protein
VFVAAAIRKAMMAILDVCRIIMMRSEGFVADE